MIYFIVNEKSKAGKGLAIWPKVKAILEEKNIPYKAVKTEHAGHATELAAKISDRAKVSNQEVTLIVMGGDGTLNEVVNGIDDFSKIRIGIIPTGSGNDFVRGAGQQGSIETAVNRILNSTEEDVLDLGKVTYEGGEKPCYYTISSGIGMDAIVCKKANTSKIKKVLNKLHIGKLTYLFITVQTLFSMTTSDIEVTFDDKEMRSYKRLIFVASMNMKAEGGGVPMAPKADAKDGKLSMCFAHGISKYRAFGVLPFLVLAKHEKLSCFDMENISKCHIETSEPVTLHADGEYLGEVSWVDFECISGMLRLIK